MDVLRHIREHLKGTITRVHNFSQNIPLDIDHAVLEIRLERLNDTWKEFEKNQSALFEFYADENFGDLSADFEVFELKYIAAKGALLKAMRTRPTRDEASLNEPEILAKQQTVVSGKSSSTFSIGTAMRKMETDEELPAIKLPLFNGDYRVWPGFRDMFLATVGSNAYLSGSQKFGYLKSFLRDEAAQLLNNITVSDSNYAHAWEKLERRYDKPLYIVNAYIESFLKLPNSATADSAHLRKLLDSADEIVRGLKALKCDGRDPWLIYLLINKTDVDTRKAWALECHNSETSTIQSLLDFLAVRCNAFEACDSKIRGNKSLRVTTDTNSLAVAKSLCPKCKGEHLFPQRTEFLPMPVVSQPNLVRDMRLCYNCLGVKQSANKCCGKVNYPHCRNNHQSLVYLNATGRACENSVSIADLKSGKGSSPAVVSHHTRHGVKASGILPTMAVRVVDAGRNSYFARVLVDTGSEVSFVTENLVKRLGLRRTHARLPILGISSLHAGVTHGIVTLALHSRFDSNTIQIQAYILNKITSKTPSNSFNPTSTSFLHELNMADSQFNTPGPIDVLLGADKAWSILLNGHRSDKNGCLLAHETLFGWIVSGCLSESPVNSLHVGIDVDHLLKSFWEIESVSSKMASDKAEDEFDRHFVNILVRAPDERYMVKMYFRNHNVTFADTFSGALSTLYAMERIFQHNSKLQQEYINFMNTYIKLGHMERIPEGLIEPTTGKVFYLPHHAVVTNKIHVVFDGSHKDSNGVSLNDTLYVGNPLQRNVFNVYMRFRLHQYVFHAVIVKMFRKIWVWPKHRDYQRIVWRDSVDKPISHFRLCTITYGTSSAPFIWMKVLRQLAVDYSCQYPLASQTILNEMYGDDILTGSDTLIGALELKNQLVELLSRGGFELGKWSSNCRDLLNETEAKPPISVDLNKATKLTKLWDPHDDVFTFKINLEPELVPTKRNLLSEISRIYDPIGFLAPTTILFKMLFQDLWLDKIGWDDPLPVHIVEKWTIYRKQLSCLGQLKISRRYTLKAKQLELVGFCDASQKAYSAVIYARSILENGRFKTELIAAKTRVAPLKQLTIPRLELCGALLLCRLIELVKASLPINPIKLTAFCESPIVLSWLASSPKKWNTFVANRTAKILGIAPRAVWRNVRSEENPANCASRGIEPKNLKEFELWWNGPPWLQFNSYQWPNNDSIAIENTPEQKRRLVATNILPKTYFLEELSLRISSWIKLLRTIAFIFRFSRNCRCSKLDRFRSYLSLTEINQAKLFCLQWAQREFVNEINACKTNKSIPKSSKLCSLSPFLDDAGLLRVGGKLTNAKHVPYNMKHQIIFPKHHPFAHCILWYAHKRHHHIGVAGLLAIIRREYWILGSRNLIRKIIHDCVVCFRRRQSTTSQLMGNLPSTRLEYAIAFNRTGCDYAGPFLLRLSKGKKPILVKGYIALFECLATKALHLELVSDLTTEAFLAALKRFIAKRGKCCVIYSNSGTNFQGASHILSDMSNLVLSKEHNHRVAETLSTECIKWEYMPPHSPHFGGLRESGVCLIKQHLCRVIGSNILTFEEMYTLLTQIELLLNSRPLCVHSDSDLNPLTPSHFLIGRQSTAVCVPNYSEVPINRLGRWELVQNMMQGFWRRWHIDYVTSLQQRPKWQRPNPNIKMGDLVVIKEPNFPPFKWSLGRVQNVHAAKTHHVRVVTLRTSQGVFKRPMTKVAVLPCS